jgi:hypothetical protein
MKIRIGITLAAAAFFLAGCASTPQKQVALEANSIASDAGRIGVAMTAIPALDTYLPGAGCLLCYAAASAANSTLTSHVKTLSAEDLPKLKDEIAQLLQKKGVDVTVIDEPIDLKALPDSSATGTNMAKKDFSDFGKKHNVAKLLVIDISRLGMERTYSSYFPTSDPRALVDGVGYIINLKTNTYEWYMPVKVTQSSDGKWDEPPKFPGLTNAYFQALEVGKDNFRKPFLN